MQADPQKAELLRQAMELLDEADALIQKAIGPSDVCYEYHNTLNSIVEDLMYDVMEFENGVE